LAGLPIVGCDIGGVRDVVEPGQQCLLVPTRDPQAFAAAMRRYLEDDELARRHGAAARCHAEQAYAIESSLGQLYSLYDQVLGTKS
jgi:glycosyltransferase involved in cell wall biosynthesis